MAVTTGNTAGKDADNPIPRALKEAAWAGVIGRFAAKAGIKR